MFSPPSPPILSGEDKILKFLKYPKRIKCKNNYQMKMKNSARIA